MIDGVKIVCTGIDPETWLDSPLLNFYSKLDTRTGEILDEPITAVYRGLRFCIAPSSVPENNGYLMTVRGSLAVYHNNGAHNGYDYTLQMLRTTLNELHTNFGINPNTACLTSFEYGANIQTPQKVKDLLNGLRAYQYATFTGLKMDGVFNGLQLKRQNTTFKAYDKGLQTIQANDNILRLEYAFKFSKSFNQYGINVLSDLLDVDKLNAIKPLLLNVWANAIFYDTGMQWRLMNNKQREKMLYYLDGVNWTNFNRSQRQKAQNNFRQLYADFCTSTTQTDVLELLRSKLDYLTAETSNKKRYVLHDFSKANESQNETAKKIRFTSLNKAVKCNQNKGKKQPQKTNKEIDKNLTEKSRKMKPKKCAVCRTDISHKKQSAKYCTKHCNNSHHAKQRKAKRNKLKQAENKKLAVLLRTIHKTDLPLLVEYKYNGTTYADNLFQSEINAPPEWIRKVSKVTICKAKNVVFASWRAKRLIKIISTINVPP